MTRILAISLVILGVVAAWLYMSNKSLKSDLAAANGEITALNKQIKGYENEISEYNTAQERAGDKIEKVRTIIKTVQADCDCYHTELPVDVRRLLGGTK